jgi:copper resistance protein B
MNRKSGVAWPLVVGALLSLGTLNAFAQTEPASSRVETAPQGHAAHGSGQSKPAQKPTKPENQTPPQTGEPAGHHETAEARKEPIPPLTDADRAAAFPELKGGHAVHDRMLHYFVLFDQLEWQPAAGGHAGSWDNKGWVGGDVNRFWFRTEGDGENGALGTAQLHALYGRAIARWWDLVVGIRQDIRPGPAQMWAAVGIQGLAPYWFQIEATGYVGAGGRTHARLETEYELLFTNRLVLQPLIEVEVYGKSDPERQIGAGLSTIDTGFRLRYEIRREVAPYVGLVWTRKFFGTADFARAAGGEVGGWRLALGTRLWF